MGFMQKRQCLAIVRTPRFSFEKEREEYYYSMLMMYLPWRKEAADLLDGYESAERHFEVCKDRMQATVEQYEHFSSEIDVAIQHFGDIQETIFAGVEFVPQLEQQNQDDDEKEAQIHPGYFLLDPEGTFHPKDVDIGQDIGCKDTE
jgi:hypothetical protein